MPAYTEEELLDIYRRGRDDPRIIDKLTELSLRPKEEVLSLLHLHDLALDIHPADKPPKTGRGKVLHTGEMWEKAVRMRIAGARWEPICRQTGIPVATLKNNWREKARELGLSVPETPPPRPFTLHPIIERSDPMETAQTESCPHSGGNSITAALRQAVGQIPDTLSAGDSLLISYIDGTLEVRYTLNLVQEEPKP